MSQAVRALSEDAWAGWTVVAAHRAVESSDPLVAILREHHPDSPSTGGSLVPARWAAIEITDPGDPADITEAGVTQPETGRDAAWFGTDGSNAANCVVAPTLMDLIVALRLPLQQGASNSALVCATLLHRATLRRDPILPEPMTQEVADAVAQDVASTLMMLALGSHDRIARALQQTEELLAARPDLWGHGRDH